MGTTPVTRATLIRRVALRANTSGYADATTLDGEVSQLVDLALAKMHNLLVGLYEDYFTKRESIPLVNGQSTYSLPNDLMKLRQVFYKDVTSGFGRYPLRWIPISEQTNIPGNAVGYYGLPYGYTIENMSLVIQPIPQNTTTIQHIELVYIPQYVPPLNDNTPIDYQIAFGWDEWVVNDAVVQIRNKAMMPAGEIMAEREKLERDIRHQAKQRNAGDPQRVRDTGWGGKAPYTRYGNFAIK